MRRHGQGVAMWGKGARVRALARVGTGAWGRWRRQPHDWDNGDMTAPGTLQGQRPSRRRSILPLVLIGVFTVLLVCTGIELYARHSIGSQVAESISADINAKCGASHAGNPSDVKRCADVGVPVQTSLGATPVLFGLASQHLPAITVRIGPLPEADLRAGTVIEFTAADIDYSNRDNPHFGSARATLAVPPAALHSIINDALKQQSGLLSGVLQVTKVTYQPDAATIALDLNNGLADLTITPTVKDGQFAFTLTDAAIAGFRQAAIASVLRSVIPALSGEYLDLLPPGFTAESVTVHDTSIDVELSGKDFTSQDLEKAGTTKRA